MPPPAIDKSLRGILPLAMNDVTDKERPPADNILPYATPKKRRRFDLIHFLFNALIGLGLLLFGSVTILGSVVSGPHRIFIALGLITAAAGACHLWWAFFR